ncbi:hypothetical protein ABG067_007752, partial [Albugo candida]
MANYSKKRKSDSVPCHCEKDKGKLVSRRRYEEHEELRKVQQQIAQQKANPEMVTPMDIDRVSAETNNNAPSEEEDYSGKLFNNCNLDNANSVEQDFAHNSRSSDYILDTDTFNSDADISDTDYDDEEAMREREEHIYRTTEDYTAEEILQNMMKMSNDVDDIDKNDLNNYVDDVH